MLHEKWEDLLRTGKRMKGQENDGTTTAGNIANTVTLPYWPHYGCQNSEVGAE